MPHDFMPGLAGVPAAKSAISDVDGTRGVLEYRGIRVEELCQHSSFLETSYLLLFGRLPTAPELAQWVDDVTHHRRIKFRIVDLLKVMPEHGHPMDALQAAVAALGMFYPGRNVKDVANNYWSAVRLIAKLPTIVAAWARLRRGDEYIPPRDDLPFSDNFLYMLTETVPHPLWSEVFDDCLILHAEHTMNASTFAGMVTASTLADPYTVVASSIGALKGPLHGGANEEVVMMLREIGSPAQARATVEARLQGKHKLMGFGHRVYKVKDPRATVLQDLCMRLFNVCGTSPLYEVAVAVEQLAGERLTDKGIYPNVDFYSGIIYDKMGIEVDLFTPLFAMARVSGWLAHWLEQLRENKLYRPDQIYSGEHDRHYVPIDKR
ncbi:MAG: citrate synthase [Nitrospira sp.]|jgi:citrate synthase|uniref:citrate synthase n=1 Tax=Nitrospira sp. ND1 TaxID=1658518 RepID=UPI0009B968D6|nr:citrate synthase [Nitrospira sp. ND1]MBK7420549.1 citrate synthase [Nitrospira sp.]MBP8103414.1 citrate synthase [Nitrospira sp.]MBP8200303.1 citrate synthase [Nitrospira sp.]SLM42075.1 Citrate synthase [Nitrospira sp. ND1]